VEKISEREKGAYLIPPTRGEQKMPFVTEIGLYPRGCGFARGGVNYMDDLVQ